MLCPVVDFFNHLNMLYGTVTEFCTPQEVRSFKHLPESCNDEAFPLHARVIHEVPDHVCWPQVRPLNQHICGHILNPRRTDTNTSGKTG